MPTNAHVLCSALAANGATVVFGIPGVHTLGLFDALADEPALDVIVNRHESGSTYAATGFAKVAGRPAVVSMVPGPGALNGSSGVLCALSDRVPMVIVTTEVNESDRRGEVHECDLLAVYAPLVKAQHRITDDTTIDRVVTAAFTDAMHAPAGPVQVLLPQQLLEAPAASQQPVNKEHQSRHEIDVTALAAFLADTERPTLMIGAALAHETELVESLATALGAPVFTDPASRGVIAEDHPLCWGLLSWPDSERVMEQSDGMLVLGSRLSEISTLNWAARLPHRLARVDADPHEVHANYPPTVIKIADPVAIAGELLRTLSSVRSPWASPREPFLHVTNDSRNRRIHPRDAVATIRQRIPRQAIVTTDATATEFWLSEEPFYVFRPAGFVVPEVQQTMGFALPAAIGAAVATAQGGEPEPIVCISGDGSLQMTLGELAPAREPGAGITLIVFDDGHYNALRIYQQGVYGRLIGVDLDNPDLRALIESYGVDSVRVDSLDDLAREVATSTSAAAGLRAIVVDIDEQPSPDRYAQRLTQIKKD